MATEKKITKRDRFNALINLVNANGGDTDMVAFLENEIALLDRKHSKTNAKASAERTAFLDLVYDALAEKGCAVQAKALIGSAVFGDEVMSSQKLSPALKALVAEGRAEEIKDKKVTLYKAI